jgi:hypothetical protein
MEYKNRLTGSVTQALIKSLLTRAGLTVVPLGIEEVVREVSDSELTEVEYAKLKLPKALRTLPDYFVTVRDRSGHWLVEVKFRKEWNNETRDALHDILKEQVKTWDPIFVVLFLGKPGPVSVPKELEDQLFLPSQHVRVAHLFLKDDILTVNCLYIDRKNGGVKNSYPMPWSTVEWQNLTRIQEAFQGVNDKELWKEGALEDTLTLVKSLLAL